MSLLVTTLPRLLAIDLHKHFIDVEGITIATVFSFQTTGINGTKFDAESAHERSECFGDISFANGEFSIFLRS